MPIRAKVTRVLLISFALALFGAVVARPLLAQAPAPVQAPVSDPSGTATGTAKDVAVKDAANPQLAEVMETVGHNKIAINMVWVLLAGFLVMFMQAGFAMVETGMTRAKNVGHTGWRRSARTSASAMAMWTSPARRSCTWSAASRRWPGRSSSARGSASTTPTAPRT